jgi:dinuclear metal center YbgI/SA1388 family protein
MELEELVDWLDGYLEAVKFPEDQSLNGLQVEACRGVESVALAVDACQAVFDKARADLLLVHHGLYWKGVSPLIASEMASRVRTLMDRRTSLYAAHLPLDAHPEVGNNPQLLRSLGLEPEHFEGITWRAPFHGTLKSLLGKLWEPRFVLDFGPEDVGEVYSCSGGGTHHIFALPPDSTLITGEFSHYGYHYAREKGINVLAMGHYATETFGVKALGRRLGEEFGLRCRFIDVPTGL